MDLIDQIKVNVVNGNAKMVSTLVQKALKQGISPQDILDYGLIEGMTEAGEKFKDNQFFVPEVLISARAMSYGLNMLKPIFEVSNFKPIGKVIIGTVKGDLHDIGKNLVAMMLKGAGFEVIDLGIDVSTEAFIEAVRKFNPQILGMSSLLTTTMYQMKNVIDRLIEDKLRDKLLIMVGGAPVTKEFAQSIGADIYSNNAAEAAQIARSLIIGSNKIIK